MSVEDARARVSAGDPDGVRGIEGSFALVARDGIVVRLARSMDRPMRYFLAKRQEGPALFVADRIDALHRALEVEGLAGQFHPSYTRMVPAHHVVELRLVGCPDPDPTYTRFFTPSRGVLPPDLDVIGAQYIGALARRSGRVGAPRRRADRRASTDRRPLFGRHRQRVGVSRHPSRHACHGASAGATEGVHPHPRRRAGPRTGAALPRGARLVALPRGDRGRARRISMRQVSSR